MIKTLLPIAVVALVAGCSNLPPGFVRVEPGDFQWRATSAGGVTAGLRWRACPKEGGPDFWAEAVLKELQQGRAYTLESTQPVSNADAEGGTAMVFTTPLRSVRTTRSCHRSGSWAAITPVARMSPATTTTSAPTFSTSSAVAAAASPALWCHASMAARW